MTKLLAHIRALQKEKVATNYPYVLRVTAEGKTHDIPCDDYYTANLRLRSLKHLNARGLQLFSLSRDDHDGTVAVREVELKL